jgi:serine/threonine protein kinase
MKLENVLFESKARTRIKVVDFGISGMCKGNISERNDAGTLIYTPPEVLTDNYSNANPAMDIWAIGMMLFGMFYNEFPFNGDTP